MNTVKLISEAIEDVEYITEDKENGDKKKLTRNEMIVQLETEIGQIVKLYHQKTGALAYLKEIK